MSLNGVIGNNGAIPWHLPEDFKWIKQCTTGHVLVMGRKTYDSIGRPLPNRETFVLTRQELEIPGVTIIHDLQSLKNYPTEKDVWIFGGSEVYRMALPYCAELYLTIVQQEHEGDARFPEFEPPFVPQETIRDEADFKIVRYVNPQPKVL